MFSWFHAAVGKPGFCGISTFLVIAFHQLLAKERMFVKVLMYCSSWLAKEGPRKDRYNISDNPQYRLELKCNQHAAVWCLLTRHITDKVTIS